MARQLSDLTVQLSGAPLAFRWPNNNAFLNGTLPHPETSSRINWVVSIYCIFFVLFFSFLTLMTSLRIAFIALWYSPLAVETTAMIDGYQDGTVSYHYFAGSTRYDKIEPASRFEPAWDGVEPTHRVFYLTFDQSLSRLNFNVPEFKLDTALILLVFSLFTFIGWMAMQDYVRRIVLRNQATHLLEGRLFKIRNRWKSPSIIYTFTSPKTGIEIRSQLSFDLDYLCSGYLHQGTMVAVLYRDDKLHTVL
jgi:hypothetical protein